MQLSKRLQHIADFVQPGERVIDVGTDHAYIPIWLLRNHIVECAIGTDIRSGPLERAKLDAERFGVSSQLRLLKCDGLSQCVPDEVDTVIIAGMGGETIIGILSDAPWTVQKRLILQPQTKQSELRGFLSDHGYRIADAVLTDDTGRIYLIWLVTAGIMPPFRGVDSALINRRDPLLRPYLDDQIKRLRKRLHGVEAAAFPDEKLSASLRQELTQLEEIHHEVIAW